MRARILLAAGALLLPGGALGKGDKYEPKDADLIRIRLAAFETQMREAGRTDEAEDARRILARLSGKPVPAAPGKQGHPGDEAYEGILKDWAELGTGLAPLAARLPDGERLSLWLGSFPGYAEAGRHLNRRRAAIGLGRVTLEFSGTYGMFAHARYNAVNAASPHPEGGEYPDAPGATPEGAAAARAVAARGCASPKDAVDGWLGAADPTVFGERTGRVSLGGAKGWWSCVPAGGKAEAPTKPVLAFPADGDEDIPVASPPPPKRGTAHLGVMVDPESPFRGTSFVVQLPKGTPGKPVFRLLDEGGGEVPVHSLCPSNPLRYAAVETLRPGARYRIEVGPGGELYAGSFTTARR